MLNCLAVGAGGFLGAVLRYLCSLLPLGRDGGFPVGTLLVNVLGAFAIGLIAAAAAAAARHAALSPRMILFLKTGICGGFTTFSTFALETSGLLQAGRLPAAAAYVVLSVLLSVGAVALVQALAG